MNYFLDKLNKPCCDYLQMGDGHRDLHAITDALYMVKYKVCTTDVVNRYFSPFLSAYVDTQSSYVHFFMYV